MKSVLITTKKQMKTKEQQERDRHNTIAVVANLIIVGLWVAAIVLDIIS